MLPNIIELNDRKFDVKRVIPSELVTDDMLALIKQLWGCDVVLRRGGKHYFVAEIEDAEWENAQPEVVHSVKKLPLLVVSGEKLDTNG
jgi:hypothetical protein